MLESLFNKVAGLQFFKKRPQHRFFPANIAKFFRTPSFNHIQDVPLLVFPFSPVTSTNVGISLQNFLTFIVDSFATLV